MDRRHGAACQHSSITSCIKKTLIYFCICRSRTEADLWFFNFKGAGLVGAAQDRRSLLAGFSAPWFTNAALFLKKKI